MDHDAVAALLGDPTAIISDADWLAIQEHLSVCDLCTAGPAVLAVAVQGELSLIRFGLEAGRSIFRPWWLAGPIIGLVITLGILSYLFFSGAPAQPVVPTATPTSTPTPTATVTATPTVTPIPTPTPMPSPTPFPATPTVPPSAMPSPTPLATATSEPPTPVATPTPLVLSCEPGGPSLTPSSEGGQDLALADKLLQLVNQARANNGLTALAEHPALTQAAQAYSEYLARTCPQCDPHQGRSYGELWQGIQRRVREAGYTGSTTPGELWIPGFLWTSAQELCTQWMSKPVHRSILLREDLREAGLGCYVRREDPGAASYETGDECNDTVDNDGDTWVNDGCAPVVCILYVGLGS